MLHTRSRDLHRPSSESSSFALAAVIAGLFVITACNADPHQGRRTAQIDVSDAHPLSYGVPLDGILSYSIDFADLPDCAGTPRDASCTRTCSTTSPRTSPTAIATQSFCNFGRATPLNKCRISRDTSPSSPAVLKRSIFGREPSSPERDSVYTAHLEDRCKRIMITTTKAIRRRVENHLGLSSTPWTCLDRVEVRTSLGFNGCNDKRS
jgi:hypothetical protein